MSQFSFIKHKKTIKSYIIIYFLKVNGVNLIIIRWIVRVLDQYRLKKSKNLIIWRFNRIIVPRKNKYGEWLLGIYSFIKIKYLHL